jgi:hypothetical protein
MVMGFKLLSTYGLGGILLAELGLFVGLVVVVVGGVGLVGLGSKLVGNGATVLGVKVLVAVGLALSVAGTLVKLRLRRVALVTSLVGGAVSDVGHRHFDICVLREGFERGSCMSRLRED